MAIYSHSKLSAFEQCKLKYKFKYIDKIIPAIEKSIEAYLGDSVHKTLEWLYKQIQNEKIPLLDDVIIFYIEKWKENYNPKFLFVKENLTETDYRNQGIKFLIDYYEKNRPFNENTLETEKKITIILDENKNLKIIGFIDRLVYNLKTGELEIHDYKTNNFPPAENHGETDRQLALYSIAIKELFGHDKSIKLIWHFLAHNKKVISTRTNEQLQELKQEVTKKIEEIESTTKFTPNKSALCAWCEYKNICPAWGNSSDNTKISKDKSLDELKENEKIN